MNFNSQQSKKLRSVSVRIPIVFVLILQLAGASTYGATPLVMSQSAQPFEYEEFLKSSSRFVSLTDSVRQTLHAGKISTSLISWLRRMRKSCDRTKSSGPSSLSKELTQMIYSKEWNRAERFEFRSFFGELRKDSPCRSQDPTERQEIEYILSGSSPTDRPVTKPSAQATANMTFAMIPGLAGDDAIFLNGREIPAEQWGTVVPQRGRLKVVSNQRSTQVVDLGVASQDLPISLPLAKGSCAGPWFDNESIEGDYAVFFGPNCVWTKIEGRWAMSATTENAAPNIERSVQNLQLPAPPTQESKSTSSNTWWIAAGAVLIGVVAYGLVDQNQRRSSNPAPQPAATVPVETIVRR